MTVGIILGLLYFLASVYAFALGAMGAGIVLTFMGVAFVSIHIIFALEL